MYIVCIYEVFMSQLPVRVEQELKNSFIAACKSQDSTASQELRKFMRDYVNKHSQLQLFKTSVKK